MISRLGFVPTSVLRLSRGKFSRQVYNFAREQRGYHIGGMDSIDRVGLGKSDEVRRVAADRRASGVFGAPGMSSADRKTLSIMPAELVEFVLRYYAEPGANYLDPFVGQGVQAQVAGLLGYNYIGTDLCEEFVNYTNSALTKLGDNIVSDVAVHYADARTIGEFVEDGWADVSFTSPPYWDVEFYSDHPGQLGTGHSYDEFLAGIVDVYAAMRPKFKPDAYVTINVNDIRRSGKLYAYHADLMTRLPKVGYRLHDIWIIDGLVGGLPKAFGVDFNSKRLAPKVHEYLIVLRPE